MLSMNSCQITYVFIIEFYYISFIFFTVIFIIVTAFFLMMLIISKITSWLTSTIKLLSDTILFIIIFACSYSIEPLLLLSSFFKRKENQTFESRYIFSTVFDSI